MKSAKGAQALTGSGDGDAWCLCSGSDVYLAVHAPCPVEKETFVRCAVSK